MPEAPVVTAPADTVPPVAPPGADSHPQPDVIPENVSKLLRNLNLDGETPEKTNEPAAKPADPKAPTDPKAGAPKDPKAEPPKDPNAPATDPGIRLRKPKVARPELPLAPPVPAATAQPKDESYKADPQWESGLDEEQREMLADAKFMEQRFPDKYKGWAARTAKFLKEHADVTNKETFDANSPEYKLWLDKNQPRLSREQIREIEEVRVADRVNKEWAGKHADLQHKIFVREEEPKIQASGQGIFAEMANTALPDDIAQAIKKDGFAKANELYALEIGTAQNVLTAATEDITELIRLSTKDPETGRPLQGPVNDPADPKFAQHERLSGMIGYFDEQFKTTAPAEQQVRGGKWFVTRDEWAQIAPNQRHRFWTFALKDYVPLAKSHAKIAVAEAIGQRRKQMKELGWQPPAAKAPPAAPPPKAPPPQPTNTPRLPAAVPTPGTPDPLPEIDARAARLAAQLNREG